MLVNDTIIDSQEMHGEVRCYLKYSDFVFFDPIMPMHQLIVDSCFVDEQVVGTFCRCSGTDKFATLLMVERHRPGKRPFCKLADISIGVPCHTQSICRTDRRIRMMPCPFLPLHFARYNPGCTCRDEPGW